MKKKQLKILLLCVSSIFSNSCFCQDILWEKSFGGKHADYLTDAIPTADYGFLLAGSSISDKSGNKIENGKGGYDYWLWKIDEHGEVDWQKSFGGSGDDLLYSVKSTLDAGFILAGTSKSNRNGDKKDNCIGQEDIWILKLDAKGNEMWQKTLGGLAQEQVVTILQTKDQGYLICGSSDSDKFISKLTQDNKNTIYKNENGKGGLDYWIVKLDRDGEFEWQKTIGDNYLDQIRSVIQTKNRGYFVAGISNSDNGFMKQKPNKGQTDIWYMQLDENGTILWQDTYGAEGDENVYSVLETTDNKLIVAGNTNSLQTPKGNSIDGSDFILLKIEPDGTFISEKVYSIGKNDVLTNVIQNKDETLLLCGYSRNNSDSKKKKNEEGTEDYAIIKIDKEGNELWSNFYGSHGKDVLSKAIETRDGGYLLAGTASPLILRNDTSSTNNALNSIQGENNQVNELKNEVNNTINDVNSEFNKTTSGVVDKANDKLGLGKDSSFGIKTNTDNSILNNPLNADAKNQSSPKEKKLPASKDKKQNYGGTDFWVVKLKDKTKPEKVKDTIEAFPNPSQGFVNVIIGYDFQRGSATVVDLAGHQLQQFKIESRTVPVDLSNYPTGIYIVNINTNIQSDGIKIIKQ